MSEVNQEVNSEQRPGQVDDFKAHFTNPSSLKIDMVVPGTIGARISGVKRTESGYELEVKAANGNKFKGTIPEQGGSVEFRRLEE